MVKRRKEQDTHSDCCDIFKALSVATRVKIIEILKAHGPLGAKKIAESIGVTPAAVSQHLKTLKQVGLVRSERRGYWIPYEVDVRALEDCRIRVGEVCSCDCGEDSKIIIKRVRRLDLKSLEGYKQQLEAELAKVNRRIGDLDAGRRE
jgi:ArsR family transcriptional regulator